MSKRQPVNTASAAIAAALAAGEPYPDPPAHVKLKKEHMPFWDGVVRERPRGKWTASSLVVAAQLARCQFDIESESQALDAEGTVIEKDGRNGPIPFANPRVGVLEQLARREMALMRTLGIGGVALGDKRSTAQQLELERSAEQTRDEVQAEGADLLA